MLDEKVAKEGHLSFKMGDDYVAGYEDVTPSWGFSNDTGASVGEFVFAKNYARRKPDGSKERWHEACRRVVEGMFSYRVDHLRKNEIPFDFDELHSEARAAYNALFNFKWLPPGRGLWACGSEYVSERGVSNPLFNCAVLKTSNEDDPALPYYRMADMLMSGIGVGYTTDGAGIHIVGPRGTRRVTIADSREGWVDSIALLMDAYFEGSRLPEFDYQEIRAEGEPINGFGGVSGGPEPLKEMHTRIVEIMNARVGESMRGRDVVDIMNIIGVGIVSGNVRRGAQIAFGEVDDDTFRTLKDYSLPENQDRAAWGWMSNNSLIIRDGHEPNYDEIAESVRLNGEPGLVYLDLARRTGRIGEESHDPDVIGFNPCAEAQLEDHELCCLAEIPLNKIDSITEFRLSISHAYRYAKTVTLLDTDWPETNEVIHRNRRLGVSVTGVAQFVNRFGTETLYEWLLEGYSYIKELDESFSRELQVCESNRLTSVKPSGSVSLLSGSTPGVHYPIADNYIRRVNVASSSPLVEEFRKSGYHVEESLYTPQTYVVSIPVKGEGLPDQTEVPIEDKAALAQLLASAWADQAVSVTLSFSEEEGHRLADVMRDGEGHWKTVSFLPLDNSTYQQMPYEGISLEQYEEMSQSLSEVDLSPIYGLPRYSQEVAPVDEPEVETEKFCDSDSCSI